MANQKNTTVRLREDIREDFYRRCRERDSTPTEVMREAIYNVYLEWLLEDTENSEKTVNKEV